MARINVTRVYPQVSEKWGWGVGDYEPMVTAFGQRTIVSEDDADYQGDSYRLLGDGDEPDQKYGLLIFGWGSCSGCDALQQCDSVAELQDLADSIQDSIKWFCNKSDLRKYMEEHDWEGDWHWRQEAARDFRRQVKEFLDSERE